MERKNIFEMLEEKYDAYNEIRKIYALKEHPICEFHKNGKTGTTKMSLEQFVDAFLIQNWKARNSICSCCELRQALNIDSVPTISQELITALEYFENIIYLFESNYKKVPEYYIEGFVFLSSHKLLVENIKSLIEHLNYDIKIFEDEEKVLLLPKNPVATSAAEISPKPIAMAILKYNHASLKGQLEEKRMLLFSVYSEYEPLLKNKSYKTNQYFDKVNAMINNLNIRHNNVVGEHKNNLLEKLSKSELEHWYDELYQLLLYCILTPDNKNRINEMDNLLKCKDGNK